MINMGYIRSILILYIFQLLFFRASCEKPEAAPVIINEGKLQLARPLWIQSKRYEGQYSMAYSIPLPPWNKIYQFCPADDSDQTSALRLAQVSENSGEAFICEKLPDPVVVKVLNIEKFKKYCSPEIEWYVSGFKINSQAIVDDLKISSKVFDSDFHYEGLNEGEAIVPGYSVFYNKTIKQMVAAQYTLLPSDVYERESVTFSPPNYIKVRTPDLDHIEKFFENSISVKVYKGKKPKDIHLCDDLKLATLVSPPHFIYWFHKRMAWLNINLIPMWYKFVSVHRAINAFLETVTAKLGKLEITSGVAGLGITDEDRKKRTYMNFNSNSKIIVSDFLWKVVEFEHMKKIYGILIIQINMLSDPNYRICEEDICSKYKWSVRRKGEENIVYCCNMTTITLNKLDVLFLNLEERLEFDLTPWGFSVDSEEEN